MKRVIFFSLFSLVSCSHQTPVNFDKNLVKKYEFVMENTHHFDTPYVAFFQKKEKELFFIVSEHIGRLGPAAILEHPTLRTIHQVMEEVRPDLVIVEGLQTGVELDPKSVRGKIKECREAQYEKGCGESMFAINEAIEYKAHYLTGEPSPLEIKKSMLKQGLTEMDLLGFYLLRQIPQLKRQGEWSQKIKKSVLLEQLERFMQQLEIERKYNLYDFEQWYRAHRVGTKHWDEVTASDCAPHSGQDATSVQKISHLIGVLRDQVLLERIQWGLKEFNKVVVVYGGSHYLTLKQSLDQELGAPRETKKY